MVERSIPDRRSPCGHPSEHDLPVAVTRRGTTVADRRLGCPIPRPVKSIGGAGAVPSIVPTVKIWTGRPAENDVEAVVRHYFDLVRAGKMPVAEKLVDHTSTRHVLKALWSGSVGASTDEDPVDEVWEHDRSWLGELGLGSFAWGETGSHLYVEITYREQVIDVALGFWVKPVDAGWVISGPSTLW